MLTLTNLSVLIWALSFAFAVSIQRKRLLPFTSSSKTSLFSSKIQNASASMPDNIILFDGLCNFCNRWVDVLLSIDRNKQFTFCALQTNKGKELLKQIGKEENDISTVVLIKSLSKPTPEVYIKSDAVLNVVYQLGVAPNIVAHVAATILPLFVRDSLYDIVAANRYNFLGKREECRCGDKDRFLS